jgi:uncharacterized membrane protein
MTTWIYGLILASFAIFIKVLGTNLQKLSHRNEERSYFRNIHWVAGLVLTAVGSIIDMAALALAPQSMVASLGGFTLVVNIGIAKVLLGESMRKIQYLTTLVIIIGTTLTVLYAPRTEEENNIDKIKEMYESSRFIIYIISIALIIGTIRGFNYMFKKSESQQRIRGIIVPISSGAIAAQNMFFGKTFGKLIIFSIENNSGEILKDYIIYVIVIGLVFAIVSHMKWLNEALKEFSSTLVVPINKSVWIVLSILAGILVMGEGFVIDKDDSEDEPEEDIGNKIGFVLGLILIILGLSFHSYFEKTEKMEEILELKEIEVDSVDSIEIILD